MKIIVAHPSPVANARIRRGLTAQAEVSACDGTGGLTDTYHIAEHAHPDGVIITAELADQPEFELLASLFRIMGIGCVVLGEASAATQMPPALQRKEQLLRLSDEASPTQILDALRRTLRHAQRPKMPKAPTVQQASYDPRKIILIGSSTGGIDALLKTVTHFSGTCPPTLIVQHTGESFANSLIRLLNGATAAHVSGATDGAPLLPGHIYLPPNNRTHMGIVGRGGLRVVLQAGEPMSGHRPSVDALFHSARPYAPHVTAALLTGMGRDGADGLLALRRGGAHTIGQDAATSVVYGMPRIAMEAGAVVEQLPLPRIGPALLQASTVKVRA